MDANIMVITGNDKDGWNASVKIGDFEETILGLYSIDDAQAFCNMHLRYYTNKYVRK